MGTVITPSLEEGLPQQAQPPRAEVEWLGRDVIFHYLRRAGVDALFGVPGTHEVPLIDGTDDTDGTRYVQCLHENIAIGAAMGHARAAGTIGAVELHVTPGIGHALGNLYNAAQSHIPVLVLCGQQHSNLLIEEPALASDLVRVAEQYTKWAYEVRGPHEIGMAMQRAIKTALAPPMGPVFLSIPWEFTIAPARDPGNGRITRVASGFAGDAQEVSRAAKVLAEAERPVIVVGDGVGAADAWEEVRDLAETLRAPVYSEPFSSYMNYPNKHDCWMGELPGVQEKMQEVFKRHDVAFLCGFNAQAHLAVYDWDKGSLIPTRLRQVYLHNDPWQIGKNHYGEAAILGDIKVTLPAITRQIPLRPRTGSVGAWLAGLATARRKEAELLAVTTRDDGDGRIPGAEVAHALATLQRDGEAPGLILLNEALSDAKSLQEYPHFDKPSSYFLAQGGSLGYSMPAALGIRLAAGEDRTVVNVIGDGAALFYPQAWWTAAKLELPILYVVLNNREYKTLVIGADLLKKSYDWQPRRNTDYLRIPSPPNLSFVELASGYGVPGTLVTELDDLTGALRDGLRAVRGENPTPYLVEVLTSADLPPTDRVGRFDNVAVVP